MLLSMTLIHPEHGFQGHRSFPSSLAQKSRKSITYFMNPGTTEGNSLC